MTIVIAKVYALCMGNVNRLAREIHLDVIDNVTFLCISHYIYNA